MERFPAGGSKQAVYDFLKTYGFTMSNWSDKHWTRLDGMSVHVYGTGSKARVTGKDNNLIADGLMEEALAATEVRQDASAARTTVE